MNRPTFLLLSIITVFIAGCTGEKQDAEKVRVGFVTSIAGLGDQSFNDMGHAGLKQAAEKLGFELKTVEPKNADEFEPRLENFCQSGFDVVVTIGFYAKAPLEKVAKKYPKVKFVIADIKAEGKNILSADFRGYEIAYVVGVLAGGITKTGQVGFLGGAKIPLLVNWEKAFRLGARAGGAKKVAARYAKTFDDPATGKAIANTMYAEGCDVIFQGAGKTGLGVIQAARESRKFVIGSDDNQDDKAPGYVLTSAMKRMDRVLEELIGEAIGKDFKPGHRSYGLREKGLELTDFKHSLKTVTPEIRKKLKQTIADIISGKIKPLATPE
ncbi:MAG: BMP family ABC transporter substrate-binding protein [Planctomycetota bacterium]|nr:MAG: BMP family ABC transporter substrate-binding protein [Planctomycetota bacterium]